LQALAAFSAALFLDAASQFASHFGLHQIPGVPASSLTINDLAVLEQTAEV
jgi:hypothetical protein